MRKLLFIASAVAFFAISCSKDQSAVRKLDGTWTLKSATADGEDFDTEGITFTLKFEKCKVKNEDCSGSWTQKIEGFDEQSSNFTYTVTDKGETIKITDEDSDDADESKITELTKDKLVVESTESGVVWVRTFEQ